MAPVTVTQMEVDLVTTNRLKAIYAMLYLVMAAIYPDVYFSKDGNSMHGYFILMCMVGFFLVSFNMSTTSNSTLAQIFTVGWTPLHCVAAFAFVWLFGYSLYHVHEVGQEISGSEMVHRFLEVITIVAMAFVSWRLSIYAKQTATALTSLRHRLFSTKGVLEGGFLVTHLIMAITTLFDYLDGHDIQMHVISCWTLMSLTWLNVLFNTSSFNKNLYRGYTILFAFQTIISVFALHNMVAWINDSKSTHDPSLHAALYRISTQLVGYSVMTVLSKLLADNCDKILKL